MQGLVIPTLAGVAQSVICKKAPIASKTSLNLRKSWESYRFHSYIKSG